MHVVLIHGMGRTPLSMLRLRQRLRKAGHLAVLFGYSSTFESLDRVSTRLARRIRAFDGEPYALVGHSLGSVITRNTLDRVDTPPLACAFLAPPMVACRAARFFSRFRLYRILTGEMGQLLADADFMRRLPLPAVPTRVFTGTAGPCRAWLPFGMEANDGILSLSEAKGPFAEAIEVPSLHSFIMHSRVVADDLARFLAAAGGEQERRGNGATA